MVFVGENIPGLLKACTYYIYVAYMKNTLWNTDQKKTHGFQKRSFFSLIAPMKQHQREEEDVVW